MDFFSELLLEKGYDVHGIIRRLSVDFCERIAHLEGKLNFHLHYADLTDSMSLVQVVAAVRPDEIYNLAAQSHVQVSFDFPEFTDNVDATGVLRVLEAVRGCGLADTCRIYQASTSELYGKVEEVPQSEKTPFHPYSPYAVAKLYGYWIVNADGSSEEKRALVESKGIRYIVSPRISVGDGNGVIRPFPKLLPEAPDKELPPMTYKAGDSDIRPWGSWLVMDAMPRSVVKKLTILPKNRLSLQRHRHRSELWTVVEGVASVQCDRQMFTLRAGEQIFLPKGCMHRLSNSTDHPVIVIEIQFGNILSEEDIEQFDDDYGRGS